MIMANFNSVFDYVSKNNSLKGAKCALRSLFSSVFVIVSTMSLGRVSQSLAAL